MSAFNDITLNVSAKPTGRTSTISKVEKIQQIAADLKTRVIANLRDNIQDQDQSGRTIVESASFLDLNSVIDVDERVEKMKVGLYSTININIER